MTHKCIQCEERFSTSRLMVQHMREVHSAFIENAKIKIDRSKEISLEAKKSSGSYITPATCPYCNLDCVTRRKLMHHLDVEHKDEDDTTAEPELKIIRVENDADNKLLHQLRKERSSQNANSSNKSVIVDGLLTALKGQKEAEKKEVSLPGTSGTITVSATSIKLEKKYGCFWCNPKIYFRKRGKLMDHIDMFHKANKAQTEEEAEMLSAMESTPHKPPVMTIQPKKVTSASAGPSKPQKIGSRRRTQSKKSSRTCSVESELPETPDNKSCRFLCLGSITEVTRIEPQRKSPKRSSSNSSTNCIFFSSQDSNPLPPLVVLESTNTEVPVEPKAIQSPQYPDAEISYPVNYPSAIPMYSESIFYGQGSSSDSNINNSPNYLQLCRPQPMYPTYESTSNVYHRDMIVAINTPEPLSTEEYQRTVKLMNYQRQQYEAANSLHRYSYPLPAFHHNPDFPLDLTLTKYGP